MPSINYPSHSMMSSSVLEGVTHSGSYNTGNESEIHKTRADSSKPSCLPSIYDLCLISTYSYFRETIPSIVTFPKWKLSRNSSFPKWKVDFRTQFLQSPTCTGISLRFIILLSLYLDPTRARFVSSHRSLPISLSDRDSN